MERQVFSPCAVHPFFACPLSAMSGLEDNFFLGRKKSGAWIISWLVLFWGRLWHLVCVRFCSVSRDEGTPSPQVREGTQALRVGKEPGPKIPFGGDVAITQNNLCLTQTLTHCFTSPFISFLTFAHFLHGPLLTPQTSRATEEPSAFQDEHETSLRRFFKRITPEKGNSKSTHPSALQNTRVETQGGPAREREAPSSTSQPNSGSRVCFSEP